LKSVRARTALHRWAATIALGLCVTSCAHAQVAGEVVTVSGSASYRQRVAMPPDAVLTVRIEDVSRAAAPKAGFALPATFAGVLPCADCAGVAHTLTLRADGMYRLRRTAQLDAITEPLRWRGEFAYMADAATFTDCASGLRWPVAMAGDYLAVERRYTQSRSAPGAPLVVTFEGRLEVLPAMEGPPREHVVIDRFGGAEAAAKCNT
jgi:uncharacterized lipoprotein NlpE involved in copper resistance